jgi:peptidoglycan/LPS O-acetylase OafA/YrhL
MSPRSVVLGVVEGIVFLALSSIFLAWAGGWLTTIRLTDSVGGRLVMLAVGGVLAGAAVFLARRFPGDALVAGITICAFLLFAALTGGSGSRIDTSLTPMNLLAAAVQGPFAIAIGVVLLSVGTGGLRRPNNEPESIHEVSTR